MEAGYMILASYEHGGWLVFLVDSYLFMIKMSLFLTGYLLNLPIVGTALQAMRAMIYNWAGTMY